MFLEHTTGKLEKNVLKMARDGLKSELAVALYKVVKDNELVSFSNMKVKTNGDFSNVSLNVKPVVFDDNLSKNFKICCKIAQSFFTDCSGSIKCY
jgi:two-component system CheB/CheR fusion protein